MVWNLQVVLVTKYKTAYYWTLNYHINLNAFKSQINKWQLVIMYYFWTNLFLSIF